MQDSETETCKFGSRKLSFIMALLVSMPTIKHSGQRASLQSKLKYTFRSCVERTIFDFLLELLVELDFDFCCGLSSDLNVILLGDFCV